MKSIIIAVLLCIELIHANSDCPKIITRNRWGARTPKETHTITTPVEYVIIHHSVTPTCSDEDACSKRLISIQNYHMDEKHFNDIGYNFMIGGDAKVYEGVGWSKEGAHTKDWNRKSMGIGFIGNFSAEAPPHKQLSIAKKLIRCGVALGEIEENYKLLGARSLRPTDSPGDALYKAIQSWKGFVRSP
ncbi:peptidoglycan recognition protein [Holotrichia oblita]|uniref:Peptidoglycan recognition protein n=1 Tax=Holotrichia oblita TaxID=644536 RepID=A0ACB9T1E4_HOLOL|nr:peptidoglycan recognition protein [Holotrichia oblita]